jgi:hypothetical protein
MKGLEAAVSLNFQELSAYLSKYHGLVSRNESGLWFFIVWNE